MIGELLVECRHHLLEGALIIGDLASVGEGKADTQCVQVLLQFGDENVAQRHRRRANLSADYLKLPGNLYRSLSNLGVVQGRNQLSVFCKAGEH